MADSYYGVLRTHKELTQFTYRGIPSDSDFDIFQTGRRLRAKTNSKYL